MKRDSKNMLMFGTALLAATALGGCGRGGTGKVDGQVVARANGTEITRTQLDSELAARGIPQSQRAAAGPVILQDIIDRTLFAKAATDAKMGQDPATVLQINRARDTILERAYLSQSLAATRSQPKGAEVDAYIDSHPDIGADRAILRGTQLTFKAPNDAALSAQIKDAMTLDALTAALKAKNVAYSEQPFSADTATLPDEVLTGVRKLAPGEPFVMIAGTTAQAVAISERVAQPLSGDQLRQVAVQRIISDRVTQAIANRRKMIRLGVKIDYAQGYAPPAAAQSK
jgi:peptidyl-prolyl cis-trans isomerase C